MRILDALWGLLRSDSHRRYWTLLLTLTYAQWKAKDQSTVLGAVWSVLHPLLFLLVLAAFFRFRFQEHIEHYTLYLLIGIVHYVHFANSTTAAMRVLRVRKDLTCNTLFPKEVLVISTVLSQTAEFIVSLLVCLVLVGLSGLGVGGPALLLPVLVMLQVAVVLWVALLLSCLYVYLRDIDHIYQVFLRALFFATPIFYDLSYVGDGLARTIVALNPLAQMIHVSRGLMIKTDSSSFGVCVLLVLSSMGLIALALRIFRRLEIRFAENL